MVAMTLPPLTPEEMAKATDVAEHIISLHDQFGSGAIITGDEANCVARALIQVAGERDADIEFIHQEYQASFDQLKANARTPHTIEICELFDSVHGCTFDPKECTHHSCPLRPTVGV